MVSSAEMQRRAPIGTTIGMQKIKDRRLTLSLSSRPGLHVGDCVPFYFCPRSPMLYMLHKANSPEIDYKDGQEPIVHLAAGLRKAVGWAEANNLRWAFTDSNAGSYYFEDYADLTDLDKIDWEAVRAVQWSGRRDKKQAEFLAESRFSWELFDEIGVYSDHQLRKVHEILGGNQSFPPVRIQREWYY